MRSIYNIFLLISAIIIAFCGMGSITSSSEETFYAVLPSRIAGFEENRILLYTPEDGLLKLRIFDDYNTYRIIETKIFCGENIVVWDGLGWNSERLFQKLYHFQFDLVGLSGKQYSYSADHYLNLNNQALIFALPSSSSAYQNHPDEWFVETRLVYDGELVVEFRPKDKNLDTVTVSKSSPGGRINTYTLKNLLGKKKLENGSYIVLVYEKNSSFYKSEFSLDISESAPEYEIRITGDIMPDRDDSDDAIWEKMMMPATVINIGAVAHQKVFNDKSEKSGSLGTLHGQSQAVSVLKLESGWANIGAWNHETGEYVEGWIPEKNLKIVEPQAEYGLLLDKKEQTLTIFREGKRIDTLLISTGRISRNALYQETSAGSFLTDIHKADFSTNGLKYDYVIRYDGGNLLHQIPYSWGGEKKDYSVARALLGSKASHGCVRIQAEPGQNGINAYWLWTHIPYHTRVIVLDDPDERKAISNIVNQVFHTSDETSVPFPTVVDEPESERKINMTFGGDVVLGGRESYYGNPDSFPSYIESKGYGYPFERLTPLFQSDNLTGINLECVLQNSPDNEDKKKQWRFRGLPEYTEILTSSSVEMVNLANNHTIDYGPDGYLSTLHAIDGKLLYCGNGINTVIDIEGYRFGFGGCRETTYLEDPDLIGRDIQELKTAGADFIIYQCHWGEEYSPFHNEIQEAMARNCARNGADLVIGHHPHVVQGIDFIGSMPVLYSLGNLMFGGTINLTTYEGALVRVTFMPEETERRKRVLIHLIPVMTSSQAEIHNNNYQPVLAEGTEYISILDKIQKDTPFRLSEAVSLEPLFRGK